MRISTFMMAAGLLALMASGAVGQTILPAPNALGLYFDGEAAGSELTVGAPATIDAYLIFTGATITEISGWEVRVTTSAGLEITGASLPVGTTAVRNGPTEWTAVMSAPLPCNPLTKLAVFSLTTDGQQNAFLYLGNVDNPSLAGDLPSVQQPDGTWLGLPVASGDPSLPVASIISSTPNEATSWGSVKSLFR